MSRMKSMLGMYAMAAMAMGGDMTIGPVDRGRQFEPEETMEEWKERMNREQIKRYRDKGLKEFSYSGGTVWALNQKSADKKAKKKGWKR